MQYCEWAVFYQKIVEDFGYSVEEDKKAAKVLNEAITKPDLGALEKKVKDKRVSIFGAGPSLEEVNKIPEGTIIAADGATTFLLERGVVPDIIVTDLDGDMRDLLRANDKGSAVVLHAHGDNIDKIKSHAKDFKKVVGTTQSRPFGNLSNFGGFTDGDRAVFLAEYFGAKEILLYGMDFDSDVGKYSFSKDTKTKRKKLKWGKRLIGHLMKRGNIRFG